MQPQSHHRDILSCKEDSHKQNNGLFLWFQHGVRQDAYDITGWLMRDFLPCSRCRLGSLYLGMIQSFVKCLLCLPAAVPAGLIRVTLHFTDSPAFGRRQVLISIPGRANMKYVYSFIFTNAFLICKYDSFDLQGRLKVLEKVSV